jgi:hypothetical protein
MKITRPADLADLERVPLASARMSRGPGRWQREILEVLNSPCVILGADWVPTLRQLVARLAGPAHTHSEEVAIRRAVKSLAAAGRVEAELMEPWMSEDGYEVASTRVWWRGEYVHRRRHFRGGAELMIRLARPLEVQAAERARCQASLERLGAIDNRIDRIEGRVATNF